MSQQTTNREQNKTKLGSLPFEELWALSHKGNHKATEELLRRQKEYWERFESRMDPMFLSKWKDKKKAPPKRKWNGMLMGRGMMPPERRKQK